MKSRSNPFLRTAALAAFSLTLSAIPADAATVTWSGVTGADWDAGANWSGSAKPATADAALFNLTGITSVANAVADQTVTGITFDTAIASTNAFTLGTTGGYALILQDTGTIQILSTLTSLSGAKTIPVNAPLELAGTSYNFVNDNATGRNTLKFGGVITSTSGTTILTLGGANAGGNTISGVISDGFSGTLGVAKTGNGAWVLAGSNTYTGGTTVSNGALTFLNTNAKPSSGTHAFAAGTTLGLGVATSGSYFTSTDIDNAFSGTMTGNLSNVTVTATTSVGIDTTAGNFTYTTSVGGSPAKGLMKLGANTLTLGGSGNNTYTGTTTLGGNGKILLAKTGGATAIAGDINLASTAWNGNNSGIVLGGNEQIADTSVITWTGGSGVYGGTLRLNGFTETIGGLVATNGGDNVVENRGSGDGGAYGTGTLTINTTGSSSYTFGGTIRDMDGGTGGGAVAIVKSGTGTQTFSGTNTYTGVTAVSNGTLVVSGNISTSTLTTVAVGATLGGTGTVGKAIVNGTLAVGNSPGQMNFTDTLGLNGITVMEIDGTAGAGVAGGHDFANLTGAGAAGVLTYGGAMTLDIGTIFGVGTYSWNLFDMASETGTFNPGGFTLADQYSGSLLDGDLNGVWDLTSGSNTWQFTESTGVLGLTVVPEPSVAALLGGIGTLMLLRRRRA
jgi:autotransporter-associated beta strand protein